MFALLSDSVFTSIFTDDQESKADDGNTDDKTPQDQPAEEVRAHSSVHAGLFQEPVMTSLLRDTVVRCTRFDVTSHTWAHLTHSLQ